jgi:hypothetical protein
MSLEVFYAFAIDACRLIVISMPMAHVQCDCTLLIYLRTRRLSVFLACLAQLMLHRTQARPDDATAKYYSLCRFLISAVKEDVAEVKANTAQIPSIKQDTSQIEGLVQQITLLRLQLSEPSRNDAKAQHLQNFLDQSTTYAESVYDEIEDEEPYASAGPNAFAIETIASVDRKTSTNVPPANIASFSFSNDRSRLTPDKVAEYSNLFGESGHARAGRTPSVEIATQRRIMHFRKQPKLMSLNSCA